MITKEPMGFGPARRRHWSGLPQESYPMNEVVYLEALDREFDCNMLEQGSVA